MIEKVISGGQTGADRGGLDAAIELGVPHGGWCPKGRRAEDGRIPDRYQLTESSDWRYETRTKQNVLEGTGTLLITKPSMSRGSALTLSLCRFHKRPHLRLELADKIDPQADVWQLVRSLIEWSESNRILILNVAGPRESKFPGIQALTHRVVREALERKDRRRRS